MSLVAYEARGWPSQPSMGGEALGLAKIIFPSTGERQGQEVGVGGLGIYLSFLLLFLCLGLLGLGGGLMGHLG